LRTEVITNGETCLIVCIVNPTHISIPPVPARPYLRDVASQRLLDLDIIP